METSEEVLSNEAKNPQGEASRNGAEADAVAGLYPEHEKLRAKQHESHVLSGFLDMLDEHGLVLAKYHEHSGLCFQDEEGEEREYGCDLRKDRLYDFGVPTKEQLIGLYLEIDPKKLSAEKDAMYRELVAANESRTKTVKPPQP